MERKIRILIAKPGLDGHDRGAKIVAKAVSDAGMEVIYTGLHQTPEQIVATAVQEDVDGIGLSILSGAHMAHIRSVLKLLKKKKAEDIFVFAGGIIPERDVSKLKGWGCWRSLLQGLQHLKSSTLFKRQPIKESIKNSIYERRN